MYYYNNHTIFFFLNIDFIPSIWYYNINKEKSFEKGRDIMGRISNKSSENSFEDYFKRATSPMMTLLLLNEKPMYVYKLSQELEKRSNSTYKMNFLYPVLYRLQQQGYVEEYSQEITESHRTRNYYSITEKGKEYLDFMLVKYRELLKAVDTIIEGKDPVTDDEE